MKCNQKIHCNRASRCANGNNQEYQQLGFRLIETAGGLGQDYPRTGPWRKLRQASVLVLNLNSTNSFCQISISTNFQQSKSFGAGLYKYRDLVILPLVAKIWMAKWCRRCLLSERLSVARLDSTNFFPECIGGLIDAIYALFSYLFSHWGLSWKFSWLILCWAEKCRSIFQSKSFSLRAIPFIISWFERYSPGFHRGITR